jgi:NADPH:quinone reductase-like Zn-dependent oxidoreductase
LPELTPPLQELMIKAFVDGQRTPRARPSASDWRDRLTAAEQDLVTCRRRHRYFRHVGKCPECQRAAAVKAAGPVHVVLDMVGRDYFARNLDVLAPDGRLVVIAVLTGALAELNLLTLMMKRITVSGSTLRARDADEKARLARAVEQQVWPWLASGAVRIPVDRTFPLECAGEAHAWLERGAQFGKVVLTT